MFVLDTNILVYAAWEECEEHERALRLVQSLQNEVLPWHMTWGIAYEFLRVSTHSSVFEKPLSLADAWRFLSSVTQAPGFTYLLPTPRHAKIFETIVHGLPSLRGNILHDTHTAALMREHGIEEIRTADTDFHVFPFLKVVDPLRS